MLISQTSTRAKKEYSYDEYLRLNEVTETVLTDGRSFTFGYQYDSYGRLAKEIYPHATGEKENSTLNYVYDDYGYPVKKYLGTTLIWEAKQYAEQGQLNKYILGNNITVTKEFDNQGRLTNITGLKRSNTYQNMSYGYRGDGNMHYRTDATNSVNKKEWFKYDTQNRLIGWETTSLNSAEPTTYTEKISYEGNRISQKENIGNYGYSGFPHHGVKSSGKTSISNRAIETTYDHNMIDGRARVSSIISGNNSVTYTHGTADELIKKTETKNGNTYTTYYAGGGKYELRIDNNNAETKLFYLGSGVVKYDTLGTTDDKILYLLKDHLGSVVKVLSINNNSIIVEESFSYDVWGNRRNATTWENTNITTPIYIYKGFTGHEHIEGFGLIHMRGRVYDPALGLFLSPDPYVQSATTMGFNRYSYCMGNPLMYTDPDGEFVFSALLAPIGLAPLGFIMDAACWGAVIGGGTYTIGAAMNPGGLSNNWNSNDFWRSVGVGAVSGAVTGGMGLIAPTFSVASTSFAANLPVYIGKAGYSMLTATVATGAGMLTYDKLDDGEINNHFSEYVKGMGIAALTAGLTSFGCSVHDYFTWDKLSISEKVTKIQNKFGTNVHYNSDLLKDGQFETINSYVEIGPSSLNKSKGYAFSVTRHELKHLKDWNKYISGDLKIPVKRTLQDHFEIRAYKLEMRYGRTTLKEYIYNLNYIKDNHGYNGFGTFTPNPFIYFNSIF